jgi:hypothetical protein
MTELDAVILDIPLEEGMATPSPTPSDSHPIRVHTNFKRLDDPAPPC